MNKLLTEALIVIVTLTVLGVLSVIHHESKLSHYKEIVNGQK